MRLLSTKANTEAPDSDFPYGRIRDKTAMTPGSKVNENMWGDIIQFFEKMMSLSGISANGLPDNAYTGFQLVDALINRIQFYVAGEATVRAAAVAAEAATRGSADTTLQTNITSEASTRASADSTLNSTKANRAQAAWTNLPLASVNWSTHPGTYHDAQYMIDEFGQVHLRGVLDAASSLSNLLSSSWMSASLNKINKIAIVEDDNAGNLKINSIDVQPDGTTALARAVPSGSTISLDGVSFWTY